jgi:hypothetical protein
MATRAPSTDGSAQVAVTSTSLDGNDLVGGHMAWHMKLRNIDRDPHVVALTPRRRLPPVPASRPAGHVLRVERSG